MIPLKALTRRIDLVPVGEGPLAQGVEGQRSDWPSSVSS
jgi:hypothetical protein